MPLSTSRIEVQEKKIEEEEETRKPSEEKKRTQKKKKKRKNFFPPSSSKVLFLEKQKKDKEGICVWKVCLCSSRHPFDKFIDEGQLKGMRERERGN